MSSKETDRSYDADESDSGSPPPAYQHLYPETTIVVTQAGGVQQESIINERSPLLSAETQVYKRRWYVLISYSLLAMTQGGLWNTWGPIAATSEDAFGWTDADIALLSNWGPIAYILAAFILSWVVDVKGLRWACIITGFLVASGAAVRCITDEPPYVTWAVHTGQLLNGLAGPVAMGVPPVLSNTWFPVEERTTATALSTVLNILGVGISFVLGPYMVPDINSNKNSTGGNGSSEVSLSLLSELDNSTARIANERKQIMRLMYVECGWSVFVFVLLLIYFPAKPPKPPTVSASIDRVDFKSGTKLLARNTRFWLICLTYGLSLGVFNCWQSVLDVILKPHNISEKEAGWIGFYGTLAGCVATVILARFADAFSRHMKMLLVFLYVGSSLSFVWFSLIIQGTLPNSTVSLYIAIILATLLLNSATPLYFEMACEVSYPVAEGITNFALTLVNNIGGLIFLGVQMIPSIGTGWENWAALGAIVSCVPVLLMFKERYNRLEIDEVKKEA
ncbi:hypothetical protein FSP39_017433 [Pinctada imbricata]|uniref:Uncharacterized protein n=1 Tax=Pinctada imbricata TaxID=66713 RepID=A0AA89BXK2_PINIB|nr:hypothetical protein FSP39_017433 [Pinctada imbricata]